MDRKKILVTGASGQLGKCLQKLAPQYSWEFHFLFADSTTLDLTNREQIEDVFASFKPQIVINAAAYTAVDQAEEKPEKAYAINAEGVENLALQCKKYKAVLIHISTDYVFDGNTEISYSEEDFTSPIGVYGNSKREGELLALEHHKNTLIIRTSWLYSEFGNNFLKTMLRLFAEKKDLNVVGDQFGQPTNANDLAQAIMDILSHPQLHFGIYHFSNEPETSWFDFAKEIAAESHSKINLNKITTAEYPTKAIRPYRSTLDLYKIQEDYGIKIRNWKESLASCIETLQQEN